MQRSGGGSTLAPRTPVGNRTINKCHFYASTNRTINKCHFYASTNRTINKCHFYAGKLSTSIFHSSEIAQESRTDITMTELEVEKIAHS